MEKAEHGVEAATRELAGKHIAARLQRLPGRLAVAMHLARAAPAALAARLVARHAVLGGAQHAVARLAPGPGRAPDRMLLRARAAGAETGDGRDESNKSLQERLADAETGQTAAEADAKAADVRLKHLTKQISEQRKWVPLRHLALEIIYVPLRYLDLEPIYVGPAGHAGMRACTVPGIEQHHPRPLARRQLASRGKEAGKLQSDLAAAAKQVDDVQAKLQVGSAAAGRMGRRV
jgi:hypothetical protein